MRKGIARGLLQMTRESLGHIWRLAIAEGATMVRIGSALFGPRTAKETG